jgi:hypothetical protein
MGRSFESIRLGVQRIADHWGRSSRALKKEDQKYGEEIVKLVKMHSSEAFIACDDPLEAAVFSALVETLKRQDKIESRMREGRELSIPEEKIRESYWCAHENPDINLSDGTLSDLVLTPCKRGKCAVWREGECTHIRRAWKSDKPQVF